VNLSRAGLDDEILIALIQTDGSTFQLTADDILALHRLGLSDRVIRAMQETARKPVAAPAPTPVAEPVAAEPSFEPPVAEPPIYDAPPLPMPPPAVVNVYQTVTQRVETPAAHGFQPYYAVPVAVPVYVGAPVVAAPRIQAPTYWGWGGQRRPDSWQPDRQPRREPATRPLDRGKGGS
jgi:hypothetical protein